MQHYSFRDGTVSLPITKDVYLNEFITQLTPERSDPPQIDDTITLAQLKQGFKMWREKTSTSPKGRILTLYKLWLTKEADHDESCTGDMFLQAILDIINISKNIQIPLTR